MTTEKGKALELAIGQIEKKFGKGSIMKLGEASGLAQVEAVSSGSLSLDLALGIGGIPRGRITEIYGPESSGKTTLGQHVIAETQKRGGIAAYIDVEHALDPTYANRCGVNVDEMLISQPDTGEQALEITEALVRSGAVDIIVVDSVAALVSQAEIEGEMGDTHVALHRRPAGRMSSDTSLRLSTAACLWPGPPRARRGRRSPSRVASARPASANRRNLQTRRPAAAPWRTSSCG